MGFVTSLRQTGHDGVGKSLGISLAGLLPILPVPTP